MKNGIKIEQKTKIICSRPASKRVGLCLLFFFYFYHLLSVIKGKLGPLTTASTISFWLTTLCALLNIVRLVPFVSQHAPSPDDEEVRESISFVIVMSLILDKIIHVLSYSLKLHPPPTATLTWLQGPRGERGQGSPTWRFYVVLVGILPGSVPGYG